MGPWRKERAEAEIFDPVTDRFTPVPLDHRLAEGHTLTAMPDGRVLLAGGWGSPAKSHVFDVDRGFAPTKRLKVPRAEHEAVTLPDGRVLLLGGQVEGDDRRSIEAFDPASGRYTKVGRMKEERDGFTVTLLQDGRVLIAGGGQVGEGGKPPRHAEIFDPVTGRSTFTGKPAS